MDLIDGHFYFVEDDYYVDFPDSMLIGNKGVGIGEKGRPFFLAFRDDKTELFWFIPVSSKVVKWQQRYNEAMTKYKVCATIRFANVIGRDSAFLIQNMFPASEKYIREEYIQSSNNRSVRISLKDQNEIIKTARNALKKHKIMVSKGGQGIISPDVLKIEQQLLKQLVTT